MNQAVERQARHQEVAHRQLETAVPIMPIQAHSDRTLQRVAEQFDVVVDLFVRALRSECKAEQLGEVTLGHGQGGELPIVGTDTDAARFFPDGDVARVEVTMDQRPRACSLATRNGAAPIAMQPGNQESET